MDNLKELKEQTQNVSVLYVEDSKEIREQFTSLFAMLFKKIDSAIDGVDALEKYKLKKYDLIITDIDMPKMNGLDLIKKIKDINQFQKIIIISAHSSSQHLLEAIKSNVDHFILKPVDIHQLGSVLLNVARSIHSDKLLHTYHQELERDVEIKTQKLSKLLVTDELTGLLNRKALNIKLEKNTQKTFILINIDNFSSINVTYGYQNGDLLLKDLANFLITQVPKDSNLYYLGSDEFVVVTNETSINFAEHFAKSLKKNISNYSAKINEFNIKFTLSIAIVIGEDNLLRNANIALKDAHTKGKNRISVYNKNCATETLQSNIKEYMPLLRLAIAELYIIPYFQPIVNIKTNKIEKFEALARIIDQNNIIHQPVKFIKIAELTGMIPDITRIMIDKTFKSFQNNNFSFSINISEFDLNDEYLSNYLVSKSKEYNINTSRVILEVLEGISTEKVENNSNQLAILKEHGFLIAIDDFGTQNSNFERVQSMNIDFIKIDGSFIKNIDTDLKSYNISKTITDFAKSIGAKVIAEYVHSKPVLDKVHELGIDFAQGYYYAKPSKEIVFELEKGK